MFASAAGRLEVPHLNLRWDHNLVQVTVASLIGNLTNILEAQTILQVLISNCLGKLWPPLTLLANF